MKTTRANFSVSKVINVPGSSLVTSARSNERWFMLVWISVVKSSGGSGAQNTIYFIELLWTKYVNFWSSACWYISWWHSHRNTNNVTSKRNENNFGWWCIFIIAYSWTSIFSHRSCISQGPIFVPHTQSIQRFQWSLGKNRFSETGLLLRSDCGGSRTWSREKTTKLRAGWSHVSLQLSSFMITIH